MKKVFLILALFFTLPFAAVAEEIMYVTATDGLRVRSEPSLSAKKINAFAFGEYVIVDKIGEEATIDGITANWVRVKFYDYENSSKEFGWVFGGYLSKSQPELGNDAFKFIRSYFKRSGKKHFLAPYFPDEFRTVYFRKEEDWNQHPNYDCTLENLCQKDFYPEHKAVTIRECMYYVPPREDGYTGFVGILPQGTKIDLRATGEYGEKGGVLFPIYEFTEMRKGADYPVEGYIRGIDITGSKHTSSVRKGINGLYTFYFQRALRYVNSESNGYSKNKIDEALNFCLTYEGAYLGDGFKMTAVRIADSEGKTYDVNNLETTAHTLELEYPLNMERPVLLIKEKFFRGGMGGGYFFTKLNTVELLQDGVKLRKAFEYGYTSADVGFDGMAYHYFTKDGAVVYEYQTDETGSKVECCRHKIYSQKSSSPYSFVESACVNGEPEGKSKTVKSRQYANPVCRLSMRRAPGTSSYKEGTIEAGTLLKILHVGKQETINGITANWVIVGAVNNTRLVEGKDFGTDEDGTSLAGWVFSGYLE